jgi:hypothetical protein
MPLLLFVKGFNCTQRAGLRALPCSTTVCLTCCHLDECWAQHSTHSRAQGPAPCRNSNGWHLLVSLAKLAPFCCCQHTRLCCWATTATALVTSNSASFPEFTRRPATTDEAAAAGARAQGAAYTGWGSHLRNVAGFIVPAPTSVLCGSHTRQPCADQ